MCILLYAVFFRGIHSEFLCFNALWDAARVCASVFLPSFCRLVGIQKRKAKGERNDLEEHAISIVTRCELL